MFCFVLGGGRSCQQRFSGCPPLLQRPMFEPTQDETKLSDIRPNTKNMWTETQPGADVNVTERNKPNTAGHAPTRGNPSSPLRGGHKRGQGERDGRVRRCQHGVLPKGLSFSAQATQSQVPHERRIGKRISTLKVAYCSSTCYLPCSTLLLIFLCNY